MSQHKNVLATFFNLKDTPTRRFKYYTDHINSTVTIASKTNLATWTTERRGPRWKRPYRTITSHFLLARSYYVNNNTDYRKRESLNKRESNTPRAHVNPPRPPPAHINTRDCQQTAMHSLRLPSLCLYALPLSLSPLGLGFLLLHYFLLSLHSNFIYLCISSMQIRIPRVSLVIFTVSSKHSLWTSRGTPGIRIRTRSSSILRYAMYN